MKVVKTRSELSIALDQIGPIGFVPTMGALHQGHLALINSCKERGLFCVVSIFVNPTQFNDAKDFKNYPIETNNDIQKLEKSGCDLLFLPDVSTIYPDGLQQNKTPHDFGSLSNTLEAAHRPGHFDGVVQVVGILFDCVKPDVAIFGEKDFQQLQIIRAFVKRMGLGIEIVGMPTVRESDGLAMSSRNKRLGSEARQKATLLFKALEFARSNFNQLDTAQIKREIQSWFFAAPDFKLEYFEIIDVQTFEPVDRYISGVKSRAMIAAHLGEVRLIDNMDLADN